MSVIVDVVGQVIPTVMRDEGFRSKPYPDEYGVLTIGYGTNLDEGLDPDEAMFLLEHRLLKRRTELLALTWYRPLDVVRQGVVLMMAYQLGTHGVLVFRRMCRALERGDYQAAADEMLDSKWAHRDSPARAQRLAAAMRSGRW